MTTTVFVEMGLGGFDAQDKVERQVEAAMVWFCSVRGFTFVLIIPLLTYLLAIVLSIP